MADIKAHKITVEQAWQAGRLSPELSIEALSSWQTVDAGIAMESGDMKLASDLCRALLEHAPQVLQHAYPMGDRSLIHLANFLSKNRDARAIPLYEEVLSHKPKGDPVWNDDVDAVIFNLSNYYDATGQFQKTFDTQKRVFEFSSSSDLLCNYVEQIGWSLDRLNDPVQTKAWYDRLEIHPSARVVVTERLIRAQKMLRANQVKAARALINAPMKQNADGEPRVLMLTFLAQSFLKEGDYEHAHQNAVDALNQSALLIPQPTDEDYVYYLSSARQLETLTETRLASPFFWNSDPVRLVARSRVPAKSQRVRVHFKVKPKGKVLFKSANPAILLQPVLLAAPGAGRQGADYFVVVSLDAAKVHKSFNTTILASCADFPTHSASLPVKVQVVGSLKSPTK